MNGPPAPGKQGEEIDLYEDDAGLDIEALRRRRELILTVLALLLVLSATVFTAWKFLRTVPAAPSELASVTALAIREAMPGLALQIGGADEMRVKFVTERLYEVSGQFIAVNQQAQSTHYVFTCAVEQAASGNWRPAKLTITPMF
jgi:hypothetical protein